MHWDRLVEEALALPVHPDTDEWALAQQAQRLIETIDGDFDLYELVDFSDDVFAYAFDLVHGRETSPIATITAEAIADEPESFLDLLAKLQPVPDPHVAEGIV